MSNEEVKAGLDDQQALAITIDAEGRGDWREGNSSLEERVAIGMVVRNRARDTRHRWPNQVRDVCLQRAQFSCWLLAGGRDNYNRTIAIARFFVEKAPLPVMTAYELDLLMESVYLADGILRGQLVDRTGGATHYYAPAAMRPRLSIPEWARDRKLSARIGSQFFFKL